MKTTPTYCPDYFIQKFSAIPSNQWIKGVTSKGNRRDAIGHCKSKAASSTERQIETLSTLFLKHLNLWVPEVNDGTAKGFGNSPKSRIINALQKIKKIISHKNRESGLTLTIKGVPIRQTRVK